MVELLDDIDTNVLAHCKAFAREQQFYANAAELNREATVLGEVNVQYPYPPKSCDDATIILQNLDDNIKTANEKLATGASNRVAKRYLDAYLTVRGQFQAWLNAKQCIATALKQEDEAFAMQLQDALNEEKVEQTETKSIDNLVIFGSLGLLFIGTMVIIFKKSKKPTT